jgi:hypothetical protein
LEDKVRELTSPDLDRLRRSNRRLLTAVLVTIGLVVLWVVLIVIEVAPPIFFGGPVLGICIGVLLVVPQRRLLRELGISPAEARQILESEKEDRTSMRLTPQQRAQRATIGFWIWLAVGVLMLFVLVAAAAYFLGRAGQTVQEDAPLDPWFGRSFFLGFIALILCPTAFLQASTQWHRANKFRGQSSESL